MRGVGGVQAVIHITACSLSVGINETKQMLQQAEPKQIFDGELLFVQILQFSN